MDPRRPATEATLDDPPRAARLSRIVRAAARSPANRPKTFSA